MDAVEPYPLVSLVLITFRQERFIKEAVRSALAQDYPNLQIVISDDCSPDGTFGIIREEADAYKGPHQLIVRQPLSNLGLVGHLFDAASVAGGDLTVVAAGDDVSYPNRVRRLVEEWQHSGADALYSDWDVIDDDGTIARRGRPAGTIDLRTDRYFPGQKPVLLAGATAAYGAETFRRIPRPAEPMFAEDLYFSLVLAWCGRSVHFVDEALVAYRAHANALTHASHSHSSASSQEAETAVWSARMAAQLKSLDCLIANGDPALEGWGRPVFVNRAAIVEDIAFNEYRARWLESSLVDRLRALARFRDRRQRRWMVPRLMGPSGVAMLRHLRDAFALKRQTG